VTQVLLLSGGIDSSAIAAILRPALALTIDYGQRPAEAEMGSAAAISNHLGIAHETLQVDLSAVGGGLLVGAEPAGPAPTPEWFPFRNQFLVTVAAAYAVTHDFGEVLVGTVGSDGARHADGTAEFVEAIDRVTRLQEGSIRVRAPFADVDPVEVIRRSGLPDGVIRWTFSCHTGTLACGRCPGCDRRRTLFREALAVPVDPEHRHGA
jgi:7-cyano-7-deazaguanine synthase